jgi:Zn-dependent peptidase ImmA (M78 family)
MTEYARLPKSVRSSAGAVPVRIVRDLRTPGKPDEKLMGYFDPQKREILICGGMAKHAQWLTLRHEQIHALLFDAGIRLRSETEERICDVLAAGWVNDGG